MIGGKCLVVGGNFIPVLRTTSLEAMTFVQMFVYFSNYFYMMTLFHPILHPLLKLGSLCLSGRTKDKCLLYIKNMKKKLFNNKFIVKFIEKFFGLENINNITEKDTA